MLTRQALTFIEGNDRTGRPIWSYATGTLTSWKGCQTALRYPTQLREVRTHAGYEATRTWENFNNQVTKMILFSNEL